jgi:hypothetical protein
VIPHGVNMSIASYKNAAKVLQKAFRQSRKITTFA